MYYEPTDTQGDEQIPDMTADIDKFIDRMERLVDRARSRSTAGAGRARAVASDGRNGAPKPASRAKIELVLYTSASSEKSLSAVRAVRRVLEWYEASQIAFTVCDLSRTPDGGDEDAVIFTPTLVKRGPGPRAWIVGNLDQADLLVELLEVNGVDRRKDGHPPRR